MESEHRPNGESGETEDVGSGEAKAALYALKPLNDKVDADRIRANWMFILADMSDEDILKYWRWLHEEPEDLQAREEKHEDSL